MKMHFPIILPSLDHLIFIHNFFKYSRGLEVFSASNKTSPNEHFVLGPHQCNVNMMQEIKLFNITNIASIGTNNRFVEWELKLLHNCGKDSTPANK